MAHQLADLSGAQEKDQHRPGPGEGRGVFALRHGRSSGRPREDDALAHIGAGEFAAERRCCREHAADARDDGCGHAFLGQPPDLLVDRAVHGGIAGVQANRGLALRLGLPDGKNHLFQCHFRTVLAKAFLFCIVQQRRVHKAARVNNPIRTGQKPRAPHRNQIRRAAARAYKVHHFSPILSAEMFYDLPRLFGDKQRSLLLAVKNQPCLIGAAHPAADMPLGFVRQRFHYLLPQAAAFQKIQAGVGRGRLHQRLYCFAVGAMQEAIEAVLERASKTIDEVDLIIPHQANVRILAAVARHMKLPMERFFINLDEFGNTSAASVPIAFAQAMEQGRLSKGMKVILVGFGGGLTYGASWMEL